MLSADDPSPNAGLSLSLSSQGLQRITRSNCDNDFAFFVGSDAYFCPSFVAEFVSPRVSALRSADASVREFLIDTPDPKHYFSSFLSVGFGETLQFEIDSDELPFVRSVSRELWNWELFESTFAKIEGEFERVKLITRLNFVNEFGPISEQDIRPISSRFCELRDSEVETLDIEVLYRVLSDDHLVVTSEDSLFETISRLSLRDRSFVQLLEFVRFEFVSAGKMQSAIELINDTFEHFTIGLWQRFANRLILSVSPTLGSRDVLSCPIESSIIGNYPDIFRQFGWKRFRLLYRGSRDGFSPATFHQCCDGHGNTLTIVKSTNDSIFGGYTPRSWNSENSVEGYIADVSLESFLFTIQNPHKLAPRIFAQTQASHAIQYHSAHGPTFGNSDLRVWRVRQGAFQGDSDLGHSYANDTGIAGDKVFTGDSRFISDEIEVFEVMGTGLS
jgi:hypothetical protein